MGFFDEAGPEAEGGLRSGLPPQLKNVQQRYIFKEDIRRFRDCSRKGLYGLRGMENKLDRDPFLAFLGEEARAVKKAAGQLFVGLEREGDRRSEEPSDRLRRILKSGRDFSLREPTIVAGRFRARPSFLLRRGDKLYVINASAKAGDLAAHKAGKMLITFYGNLRAEWRDHVLGLAFDCEVLRRLSPDSEIVPFLLLPCGNLSTAAEEAEIAMSPDDLILEEAIGGEVAERRRKSVLRFFDAGKALELANSEVRTSMEDLTRMAESEVEPKARLRYACRNCEYRMGRDDDGFSKCWGSLAKPTPHIFDLHQLYSLKFGKGLFADRMIGEGCTGLLDVSEENLHGEHRGRQLIQLACVRADGEWIDPALLPKIEALEWPVRFVDFETSQSALPWLEGVKPYELLPFQWSQHTLHEDGRLVHDDWLHNGRGIPTAEFVATLRAAVGEKGSVLIYTPYEIQVLDIAKARLFEERGYDDDDVQWIERFLTSMRIVDQHEWVLRHYCHPLMGGRTSLKTALPAAWRESDALGGDSRFEEYARTEVDGKLEDPYATLPSVTIGGKEIEIREGCGAMKGYRLLATGSLIDDPVAVESLRAAMLAYCKLDTAAQAILFEHWRRSLGVGSAPPWKHKIPSSSRESLGKQKNEASGNAPRKLKMYP